MSCGRGDEEAGDEMPARQNPPSSSSICGKCRIKPVQITRLRAGYCADCFVGTLGRRFKDVMHLAREHCRAPKGSKDRTNGSILLAFSDSLASRTVLDLLREHYFAPLDAQARTKPAFSKLEVLHVRQTDEEDQAVDALRLVVEEYGFELTTVVQEEIFRDSSLTVDASSPNLLTSDPSTSTPRPPPPPPVHQHPSLSSTSQETFSSATLSAYITHYAYRKGHRAILFCESSTKLAAKTLSAMAKGQGYGIGEMVASAEVPVVGTDVRIYRPLANISGEEIRFYASSQVKNWSLSHIDQQGSSTIKGKGKAGIDGLVESFVQNLEAGFPSTVSVISRTAAKLGMRSKETHINGPVCPMCGLPSDPNAKAWREAASLSSLSPAPSTSLETSTDTRVDVSHTTLADKLCYGCLVPFLELQGKAQRGIEAIPLVLPAYSQHLLESQRVTKQESLRAEIEEFLL